MQKPQTTFAAKCVGFVVAIIGIVAMAHVSAARAEPAAAANLSPAFLQHYAMEQDRVLRIAAWHSKRPGVGPEIARTMREIADGAARALVDRNAVDILWWYGQMRAIQPPAEMTT